MIEVIGKNTKRRTILIPTKLVRELKRYAKTNEINYVKEFL